MNNKRFQVVNKKGKVEWVVVRQVAGIDKLYKLGDYITGLGRVIGMIPSF